MIHTPRHTRRAYVRQVAAYAIQCHQQTMRQPPHGLQARPLHAQKTLQNRV